MKKLKLLFACIFLCTATAFANVEINETNFPDSVFRAFVSNLVDGRDMITYAEIAEVTKIDVSLECIYVWTYKRSLPERKCPKQIYDLTGINFFTNLEVLYCAENQLTSLDISNLTNLRRLNFSNNLLTSFDASGLTNLQYLNSSFNQLTLLDVSNLINLRELNCSDNRLTVLDVSSLINLEILDVGFNQLTVLDVSNLINLQRLSVWFNGLTSLDVSNLKNLVSLNCMYNQLTSLDVSGLTNLMWLHSQRNQLISLNLSGLKNLRGLHCCNNQLTSLDVSDLINLRNLWCEHNQFTSFDVSNLTNLQQLVLNANQLTSLDVTGLNSLFYFFAHGQNPSLTLTGRNNNYNLAIDLNNPTGLVSGLTYENGILTSTSNTITTSHFSVETGHIWNRRLSGRLTLFYTTETNTPEININRTPIAFYTITGVRLGQKPQSGIFIILYDDGSAEKVMR